MPTTPPDRLELTYERAVVDLTEAILDAPYPRWYVHINQLPLPERLTYCLMLRSDLAWTLESRFSYFRKGPSQAINRYGA